MNLLILILLLFLTHFSAPTHSAAADVSDDEKANGRNLCGHRPLCRRYEGLCQAFGQELLGEFMPGELPFIAKLSVAHHQTNSTETHQCVGVVVSEQDVLVNGECNRIFNNGTTVSAFGSLIELLNAKNLTKLTKEIGIITENSTLKAASESSRGGFNASCLSIAWGEEVELNGVVCGIQESSKSEQLGIIGCRSVKFSNHFNENAHTENQLKPLNDDAFDKLLTGAAVFRRSSNDVWSLIGFTNSNGTITTISKRDCYELQRATNDRVKCSANGMLRKPEKNVGYQKNEKSEMFVLAALNEQTATASTVARKEPAGSPLLPLIVLMGVMVLAVALFVSIVREGKNRNSYQYI